MFGLIARSSSRLLTQTRAVSRLARKNPLASLSGVHVSRRTLSSATEEPEEISSLPDNRFEGVGQPFDKQIAGILSQSLDDAEVSFVLRTFALGLKLLQFSYYSNILFYVSYVYSMYRTCVNIEAIIWMTHNMEDLFQFLIKSSNNFLDLTGDPRKGRYSQSFRGVLQGHT